MTASRSSPRIAAGALKGRRLPVASGVRPTGSRLREALFSIWQSRVEGCRFLDLFAGSGAVGLEAISRGASLAVFVEGSARAFKILRQSVLKYAPDRARAVRAHLPGGLDRLSDERFGLIFADPPYAYRQVGELLQRAVPRLQAGGELALEHDLRLEIDEPQAPWRHREKRCYGDSCLSFFVIDGPDESPLAICPPPGGPAARP